MRELGFPRSIPTTGTPLISPAASPTEARKKIFETASAALKTQAVIDAYAAAGGVVGGGTSAELGRLPARGRNEMGEVVKFAKRQARVAHDASGRTRPGEDLRRAYPLAGLR